MLGRLGWNTLASAAGSVAHVAYEAEVALWP